MSLEKIKLKNSTPLAKGKCRLLFKHPDNPALLIKVIDPSIIEARFGPKAKLHKRLRRSGKYVSFFREIQEYLAVHAKTGTEPDFLQKIIGFAQTDLQLGLVVEGVFQKNGDLAPPLGQLLSEHLYDEGIEAALESCFQKILECPVVLSDMNVGNFVYLSHENRFVVIDGTGNVNPLGMKGQSDYFNRKAKLRGFERLRARIERYKEQYQYPA